QITADVRVRLKVRIFSTKSCNNIFFQRLPARHSRTVCSKTFDEKSEMGFEGLSQYSRPGRAKRKPFRESAIFRITATKLPAYEARSQPNPQSQLLGLQRT